MELSRIVLARSVVIVLLSVGVLHHSPTHSSPVPTHPMERAGPTPKLPTSSPTSSPSSSSTSTSSNTPSRRPVPAKGGTAHLESHQFDARLPNGDDDTTRHVDRGHTQTGNACTGGPLIFHGEGKALHERLPSLLSGGQPHDDIITLQSKQNGPGIATLHHCQAANE
jgi:hypothetical protein